MISTPPQARAHNLRRLIDAFLASLHHENRSPHTRRAYASDLARFASFYASGADGITAEMLRAFFATLADVRPATRARKLASAACFRAWAYQEELIDAMPMARVKRVKLDPSNPRGIDPRQIRVILAAIPTPQRRDHLLFHLIATTGLRIGEALSLYVEDVDLTTDDEHVRVLGKGNRPRTVPLDDPRVVKELRAYMKLTRYSHRPLFRAAKNGRGGPGRYQTIQARWQGYCGAAGVACTVHQLRHTHATQLVNAVVGLATTRKRLGHKNLPTTPRYAEQADATADAELRAWQRQR